MPTFVCLLRGVNLTGNNKLPMARFRESLEARDCTEVRTYIQSGNAVFCARGSARSQRTVVEKALDEDFGLRVDVLVLSVQQLEAALRACPFVAEAEADPKQVSLLFLGGTPEASALTAANKLSGPDRFSHIGQVIYLHTPGGFGKSKLALLLLNRNKLGVTVTARNYRSAVAIRALAG